MVLADAPATRVDRGETLVKFLRRYERSVRVVTTMALEAGPPLTADVVFVGCPTGLTPRGIERLPAGRLVAFDYFDEPAPMREAPALAAAGALEALGARHLKTHRERVPPRWAEPAHTYGLRVGLLPIRYNAAVAAGWRRHRASAPWRRVRRALGAVERPWDVSLHGSVTYLERPAPKGIGPTRYEQRIDWMRELRTHPEWTQWGALHPVPYRTVADVMAAHGPQAAALFDDGPRLAFAEYFRRMTRTRVALCPTGHARWTYRHVESVYAGCEVVSTDLTGIDTLVPAPLEAMTLVADHAPVAPAVFEALARWDEREARRRGAIDQLQQWLDGGRFVAGKRRAFEAFLDQLGE